MTPVFADLAVGDALTPLSLRITRKNRRNDPDRLEIKKFCPNCGVHRKHKETR